MYGVCPSMGPSSKSAAAGLLLWAEDSSQRPVCISREDAAMNYAHTLYPLNQLTFDLIFCMSMGHDFNLLKVMVSGRCKNV